MALLGPGDNYGGYAMTNLLLSDWTKFLRSLINLYEEGVSEQDISKKYRGTSVEWEGRVKSKAPNENEGFRIAMNLGDEMLPIKNGKFFRSSHISLNVDKPRANSWMKCQVGDLVRFKGRIPKGTGLFPEIRLSEFEGDPEVVLMLGLIECELLETR